MSKYQDNIAILQKLQCNLNESKIVTHNEAILCGEIRRLQKDNKLLDAVKAAYQKHHMGDNSIGWEELSTILHDALCTELGDEGFCKWADTIEPLP